MFKFGAGTLLFAGMVAAGCSVPAEASLLTYDITLTQTSGTLITGSPLADFTATTSFTVQAPTSDYQQETTSDFTFTIAGKMYTSDLTLQFHPLSPLGISSYYGFSGSSGGDTLSIGGGNSFNLYGTGISSTDGGTVAFALVSPTPLPATLPLFVGGLGFIGYLTRRKKRDTQACTA